MWTFTLSLSQSQLSENTHSIIISKTNTHIHTSSNQAHNNCEESEPGGVTLVKEGEIKISDFD